MIQNLKNGKQVLVTGSPIFDKNGNINMVVVNDRDISQLNQLRAKLDRSRALRQEDLQKLSYFTHSNNQFPNVIIRSAPMHRVFSTAMKVAQVDSNILIRGESGCRQRTFCKTDPSSIQKKKRSVYPGGLWCHSRITY